MRRVLRMVIGLGSVAAANTASAGPENLLIIADPAKAGVDFTTFAGQFAGGCP